MKSEKDKKITFLKIMKLIKNYE